MMEVCQVAFGADDLAEGAFVKVSLRVTWVTWVTQTAVLSLRADFGDAIAAGQTVQEFAPNSKATAEANALGEVILARLGV